MTSRISFLLIALFWLTMTYLLWRAEYVGQNQVGSSVPVELAWGRILTAPDNSALEIMHNGRKVGYCRWASNIGQELAAGKFLTDGVPPEGMTQSPAGYQLDLEGNAILSESSGRLRFSFEIKLSTNHVWQEFNLRLNLVPMTWEVHSRASEETVRLVITRNKADRTERVFKFADLQNPQALLRQFDAPGPMGLLEMLGSLPGAPQGGLQLPSLDWKARNDWISIGHTPVRAYRLEATLLERYRMLVIVSRVGEILRVELPDGWELVNDQLNGI